MVNGLHQIWNQYGEIPSKYEHLISIRGIGQYIAGAVVVFSQNIPLTLIDTNTVRVIGRLSGLNLRGEARRRKDIIMEIGKAVDKNNPRDYYYAIIDIAHLICLAKNPLCKNCPLLKVPCDYGNMIHSNL